MRSKTLNRAVQLNPDMFEAYLNWANIYEGFAAAEAGLREFPASTALQANSPQVLVKLGRIHANHGSPAQSKHALSPSPGHQSGMESAIKGLAAVGGVIVLPRYQPQLGYVVVSRLLRGRQTISSTDFQSSKLETICDGLEVRRTYPLTNLQLGYVKPDLTPLLTLRAEKTCASPGSSPDKSLATHRPNGIVRWPVCGIESGPMRWLQRGSLLPLAVVQRVGTD